MVLELSTVSSLAKICDSLYGKGFLRLEKISGQYMLVGDGVINVDHLLRNFTRVEVDKAVLSPNDTFALYTGLKNLIDYYNLTLTQSRFSNDLLIYPTKKGMEVYAFMGEKVEPICNLEFFSSDSGFIMWLLKVIGKIE
nr:MAG TPA: hypothetical protein [Bacteriophage sp.]DAS09607.1 MAG TPA: hypothetical protein [Bacteriophage sp.]